MHILFLTDNFPPEVNAPASRTFEHCREWVNSGHQVTVITCAPNFPQGKVYQGYDNRLWQTEIMDGIKVIRVWSYITANEGCIKRILDYLSYMFTAIIAAPFVAGTDLVIGTSPQFFTVCAAYVVSRFKRIPFVFELRDLWPESIKAVGAMRSSLAIRFFERIELSLYRKASAIVSVTNSFKRTLISRGISEEKITVVTNGVDLSRFQPQSKDPDLVQRLGLHDRFVAGYIGTHGMAHSLETLLEAAATVRLREGGERVRFIFLGNGARKAALQEKAAGMNLDNVLFLDSVSKEDVARYWSLLDVSIIHLKNTPLFETVIPSKIFEAMGMGIPILHGVNGESADIIRNEDVGMLFAPESPGYLCDSLIRMMADPEARKKYRDNCLQAARNYDRKVLAKRVLDVLEKVATPKS